MLSDRTCGRQIELTFYDQVLLHTRVCESRNGGRPQTLKYNSSIFYEKMFLKTIYVLFIFNTFHFLSLSLVLLLLLLLSRRFIKLPH